jgi:hypothetical protein
MNLSAKSIQVIGIFLLTPFVAAAACLYFDVPARVQTAGRARSANQTFTCPMHPEAVQDHPGNCPKCGMVLKPASVSSAPPECANHDSGCCAKPAAGTLSLPPGHPPIDGYLPAAALPGCTNHLH